MPEVETDNSSNLLELAAKWMRKRRWHELLGKHGQYSQSLFHHILVQLNLLVAIRPLLCDRSGFGLSDEQFLALFVGNLCHDVGKEAEAWQEAVRTGARPPDHVHHEETQRAVEEWSYLLVDAEHRNGFMATALAGVGLHHKATQGPASVLDQLIHGEHTDSREVDHAARSVEPLNGVSKGGEHSLWSILLGPGSNTPAVKRLSLFDGRNWEEHAAELAHHSRVE